MPTLKNSIAYHTSEKDFYRFTDSKKLSSKFKENLTQVLETFECVVTSRSKRIYYKNSNVGIWDIHLPNPGIKGKNAFRMLCVIDTLHKKITLCYLFPRENLKYGKTTKKLGEERWNTCVDAIRAYYF